MMPRYVTFFSYTGQTWDRMISNPGDRMVVLKATAESLGASVESLHFMLGEHDGMVVVNAPDSVTMAAFVTTALGSVALASAQTHELFTQEQLGEVLAKAGQARAAYRPPGA